MRRLPLSVTAHAALTLKAAAARLFVSAVVFGVVVAPRAARAEQNEWSVGLESGLALLGFESQDQAQDDRAFALATWSVGGVIQYGVLDDLFVEGRLSFSTFEATTRDTREGFGKITGNLAFVSTQVHPEVGLRYNLLGGYDFSIYAEGSLGLLWSIYSDHRFENDDGASFGLQIDDEGQGVFTAAAAIALEYRVWNLFLVSVSVRHVEGLSSGRFERKLMVPVQLRYTWM